MKTQAGLWIDHEQAVVVLLGENGEEVKKFHAEGPEPAGASSRSGAEHKHTPNDFISEVSLQRKRAAIVDAMFDEVLTCLGDVESLLIVGPGEAKLEFNKHLQGKKLRGIVTELETSDKLTERQIVAKVKEHFAGAAR